jgi:hypothetical protein
MTIVRLTDGTPTVHSPIRLTDELRSAAASAGRVRFIVAPNRFHHLFVPDWQKAYPDAQTFCAPGLDTKRADLKFTAILGDDPPAAWADEMDQAFMRAFPPLNQIVFFHRKTRTLIFTDLLFNIARRFRVLAISVAARLSLPRSRDTALVQAAATPQARRLCRVPP